MIAVCINMTGTLWILHLLLSPAIVSQHHHTQRQQVTDHSPNMSQTLHQGSILGSRDVEELSISGLLMPAEGEGMRRLHKRRAHRSSDEENQDIPLDVRAFDNVIAGAFVTIPDILISKETLIYVGFNTTKADELWKCWSNWPAHGPQREVDNDDGGLQVTFEDFITLHMGSGGSPDTDSEEDLEWTACLTSYGLSTEVQNAILDPLFKGIRFNQTASFWARDTVAMRYAGLQDIQRASRDREMAYERAASRAIHGRGGRFLGPASSSVQNTRRSLSGMQADATTGVSIDTCHSAKAIAIRDAPGRVVLYKGMDKARINNLWDDNTNVVHLPALATQPPSDFSGTRTMYYFTPDYKVAECYAAYAKRRGKCESVVIISISIPNAAIERLESTEIQRLYWPSPEWKELVWLSRRSNPVPRHLRKYRQAMLVIGNTAKCPDVMYGKLDTWEAVREKHLLKVNGPAVFGAVQYVFSGEEDGIDWLMEHGARNLKAWPMTSQELEAWSEHQVNLIASE
jgi:hypothetical protein